MRALERLVLAFLVAAICLQAQTGSPAGSPEQAGRTFRLDPNRPFVYLRFDHIGEGARINDKEPSTRIWLHLVNNCRLPIVVNGGGTVKGGLKDEVFIDNVVKLNPPIGVVIIGFQQIEPDLPPVATMLSEPGQQPNPEDSSKNSSAPSPTQSKLGGDDETPMPLGYPSGDVVTTETIMPGADVLFSVPVNFVTRKWHFEINVSFDSERTDESIPEQSSFTDPTVRGHVEMTLTYGFYDLPEEYRDEVEKLSQKPQKKP